MRRSKFLKQFEIPVYQSLFFGMRPTMQPALLSKSVLYGTKSLSVYQFDRKMPTRIFSTQSRLMFSEPLFNVDCASNVKRAVITTQYVQVTFHLFSVKADTYLVCGPSTKPRNRKNFFALQPFKTFTGLAANPPAFNTSSAYGYDRDAELLFVISRRQESAGPVPLKTGVYPTVAIPKR